MNLGGSGLFTLDPNAFLNVTADADCRFGTNLVGNAGTIDTIWECSRSMPVCFHAGTCCRAPDYGKV